MARTEGRSSAAPALATMNHDLLSPTVVNRGLAPAAERVATLLPSERDRVIAAFLSDAESNPPASWTGSSLVHREHAPAYFQYPAMMSPVVQRDLLRVLVGIAPRSRSVIDPFAGSGTVLSEAMYAGLECWVSDLNPLAVLLCQLKAGEYAPGVLVRRRQELLRRLAGDRSRAIGTTLRNWRKWFRPRAARELSKLRRGIRRIRDRGARRFFWACLAETVRLTSNSRTSTYKLHIRTAAEIEAAPWPLDVFEDVSEANIAKHRRIGDRLRELHRLEGTRYSKRMDVRRQDARDGFPRMFDILMTSPPYGDNMSTVPYGQSAFLSQHWIDLGDIDDHGSPTAFRNAYELDRMSLGGQLPRWKDVGQFKALRSRSPVLDRLLRRLAGARHDRARRILGFVRDLAAALPKVLCAVHVNGYLAWTVGNRRVGGVEVPLADILTDLLCQDGAILVGRCTRRIPWKRMAIRNAISVTIRTEHLLVFRRIALLPGQ